MTHQLTNGTHETIKKNSLSQDLTVEKYNLSSLVIQRAERPKRHISLKYSPLPLCL